MTIFQLLVSINYQTFNGMLFKLDQKQLYSYDKLSLVIRSRGLVANSKEMYTCFTRKTGMWSQISSTYRGNIDRTKIFTETTLDVTLDLNSKVVAVSVQQEINVSSVSILFPIFVKLRIELHVFRFKLYTVYLALKI